MNLSDAAMLAIDETSFKRGHKYVTFIINAAKRRVIDIEEGRNMETMKQFAEKRELFCGRRLFMIPQARPTVDQSVKLAKMSKRHPQTGRTYRIVAGLDDFYANRTAEEAEKAFNSLYSWMRHCRLAPMKKAAETLVRHKDKILAYFKNRITNAIYEEINSVIQAAKRKARGFHTFIGYSSMIYLVAGKLQLALPKPF